MRKFIVIIVAVLLSSCAGGTLGNLIPLPKFLEGRIEQDVYHSPQGLFQVMTPFAEGSTSFRYMEVKEGSQRATESVIFSSTIHSNERYRVEVTRAKEGDNVREVKHYLSESEDFFETRYRSAGATNFARVSEGNLTLDVGVAGFIVARYIAPSAIPYQAWLLVVAHASPKGLVFLSFDFDGDCEACRSGDIEGIRVAQDGIDRMLGSISVDWTRHADAQ